LFAAVRGVLRTTVGYTGGKKDRATYHSIGDHTESVQIEYDDGVVQYEELVKLFWQNHTPSRWSSQYKSVIFYHTDEQKAVAEEYNKTLSSRKVDSAELLPGPDLLVQHGEKSKEPASTFYYAEDYHQKYYLQRGSVMFAAVQSHTTLLDFIRSFTATKVLAYSSGYGSLDDLQADLPFMKLSDTLQDSLLERFQERSSTTKSKKSFGPFGL